MRRFWIWLLLVMLLACGRSPIETMQQGDRLAQQGDYEGALAAYNLAIQHDPDNSQAHFRRGNVLYRQGRFAEALAAYLAALHGDAPVAPALYYNLGNAAFRMGDLEQAIEAYKNCLRLRPDDLKAKHNLEFALRRQSQIPLAKGGTQGTPDAEGKQASPLGNATRSGEGWDHRNQTDEQMSRTPHTFDATKHEPSSAQPFERLLDRLREREKLVYQRQIQRRLSQARDGASEYDW